MPYLGHSRIFRESLHVCIHTLNVCEKLKIDIVDFESPCDMLIAVSEEVSTVQKIKE